MTARYRNVFTGLGDSVIDISDEEGETDVSKGYYFIKHYFDGAALAEVVL
jgi:hypothetical protein